MRLAFYESDFQDVLVGTKSQARVKEIVSHVLKDCCFFFILLQGNTLRKHKITPRDAEKLLVIRYFITGYKFTGIPFLLVEWSTELSENKIVQLRWFTSSYSFSIATYLIFY